MEEEGAEKSGKRTEERNPLKHNSNVISDGVMLLLFYSCYCCCIRCSVYKYAEYESQRERERKRETKGRKATIELRIDQFSFITFSAHSFEDIRMKWHFLFVNECMCVWIGVGINTDNDFHNVSIAHAQRVEICSKICLILFIVVWHSQPQPFVSYALGVSLPLLLRKVQIWLKRFGEIATKRDMRWYDGESLALTIDSKIFSISIHHSA